MVELSRSAGAPGDVIRVTGVNFPVNARLRMMDVVGPQAESLLGRTPISTSADGKLTVEFVVPDVRPGRYTFQVSTDRGGALFTVLPGVAATPTPATLTGPPLHPSLAGYSTLFASVMSTLPAQSYFEMLASLEGPPHAKGCACQPCQVKRACLQKAMTLMARSSPALFQLLEVWALEDRDDRN